MWFLWCCKKYFISNFDDNIKTVTSGGWFQPTIIANIMTEKVRIQNKLDELKKECKTKPIQFYKETC